MLDIQIQWSRNRFKLDLECRVNARITGVFGPSAAGKTSLLHVIAGLAQPDAGKIVLDDEVLLDTSRGVDLPAHLRGLAIVFQEGRLFPHYSVRGNLAYGAEQAQPGRLGIPFDDVVSVLDMANWLDRRPDQLSGGQAQRVALARALLSAPRMLLLDEPLSSLDEGLKTQVLPYLSKIKSAFEVPMLYVSHNIGEILQLTEELLVLEEGRLLGAGRFRKVISDDAVFRLASKLGLENVIAVRVAEHRKEEGLTVLHSMANTPHQDAEIRNVLEFLGPPVDCPIGAELHVAIRPQDVALASREISGLSIQNQLCGEVQSITDHAGKAIIDIDVGTPLLAELSRKAVGELGLAPGKYVCCLIKAHAIRYIDR